MAKRKSKPSLQLWRVDLSAAGAKVRVGNLDPQLIPGQITSMLRIQPSLLVLVRKGLSTIQVNLMSGEMQDYQPAPKKVRKSKPVEAQASPTAAS